MTSPSQAVVRALFVILGISASALSSQAAPEQCLNIGFYPLPSATEITGVSSNGVWACGRSATVDAIRYNLLTGASTNLSTDSAGGMARMAAGTGGVAHGSMFYPVTGPAISTGLTTVNASSMDGEHLLGEKSFSSYLSDFNRTSRTYVATKLSTSASAISSDGSAYGGRLTLSAFLVTPSGGLTYPGGVTETVVAMSADPYGLAYAGIPRGGRSDFLGTYNGTGTPTIVDLGPPEERIRVAAMSGDWKKPVVVGHYNDTSGSQHGWVYANGGAYEANNFVDMAGVNRQGNFIYEVYAVGVTSTTIVLGGQAVTPQGAQVGFVAVVPNWYGAASDEILTNYWRAARAFSEGDTLNGYLYISNWLYYYYLPKEGQTAAFKHYYGAQALYQYIKYSQAGDPRSAVAYYNYFIGLSR